MADKTIKQLADELGVSKDKIKYQVRKLPDNYLCKKGNITYINDIGISIIKENLQGTFLVNTLEQTSQLPSDFTHLNIVIETLREQLRSKEKQLEVKDKQIDNLQQALNNTTKALTESQETLKASQLLHAKDIQLISAPEAFKKDPKVTQKRNFFNFFKKE